MELRAADAKVVSWTSTEGAWRSGMLAARYDFATRGFGGFFIFLLGYGGFLGVKKPHARAKRQF